MIPEPWRNDSGIRTVADAAADNWAFLSQYAPEEFQAVDYWQYAEFCTQPVESIHFLRRFFGIVTGSPAVHQLFHRLEPRSGGTSTGLVCSITSPCIFGSTADSGIIAPGFRNHCTMILVLGDFSGGYIVPFVFCVLIWPQALAAERKRGAGLIQVFSIAPASLQACLPARARSVGGFPWRRRRPGCGGWGTLSGGLCDGECFGTMALRIGGSGRSLAGYARPGFVLAM